MKEELEKIYNEYFPFEHQNCSDECGKKSAEITMRQDFVKDIKNVFYKILPEPEYADYEDDYEKGWNDFRGAVVSEINENE